MDSVVKLEDEKVSKQVRSAKQHKLSARVQPVKTHENSAENQEWDMKSAAKQSPRTQQQKEPQEPSVALTDCLSAYRLTCRSIESYCRCLCPHQQHVKIVIYQIVVAIILIAFLVIFFVGVTCQVQGRDGVRNTEVLVPAPAPTTTTTTIYEVPDPYYRLTLEGGNYYSFAEFSSPDCTLTVIEASSQLLTSGHMSAEATVDGDTTTCYMTPEQDMSVYGPTYIVYACSARTRSFNVDTQHHCDSGPITNYTIEWSLESDGNSDNWLSLNELAMPEIPIVTTTTTTTIATSFHTAEEYIDQRANVQLFTSLDCAGDSTFGIESMDLCYYGIKSPKSIQILKSGTWISTYETCFLNWDTDPPSYVQSITGQGCHNLDGNTTMAVEIIMEGQQLCMGGFMEGIVILTTGAVLLLLYMVAAICPPAYYAANVLQVCTPLDKREKITFRD